MRTRIQLVVISLVLGLAFTPAWAGKLFKYKDENGKVHYTDSKSKIPRKYRKAMDQLRSSGGGSGVGSKSALRTITNEDILKGLDAGKRPEEMMPGPPKPSEKCYAVRGIPEKERVGKEVEECLAKLNEFEKYNQDFLKRWDEFQEWNYKRGMAEKNP